MAVFFLTSGCFPNMVGHISVSYVNIARIPFSELEADLALRCSFLFQLQFFYLLPKVGILGVGSSHIIDAHIASIVLQDPKR